MYKNQILIFLILLIILLPNPIIKVHSDISEGDFTQDTDNDAPIFISWYDSQTLIDPETDVLFYTTVEDIDNSSTELTVTLYYSNDTFGANNYSENMGYAYSVGENKYHYTYLFPGEPYGVYYQYYYQIYDGFNYVKIPTQAGIYFDIQWDLIIQAGDINIGGSNIIQKGGSQLPFIALLLFVNLAILVIVIKQRK